MSVRHAFSVDGPPPARLSPILKSWLTIGLAAVGSLLLSSQIQAQTRHVFVASDVNSGADLFEYTSTDDINWTEKIVGSQLVYGSNIASFAGGGQLCVAYVGRTSQNDLHQHVRCTTDDVNWTDTDLSTVGAYLPDATAGVSGFVDSNGHPRIFYITQIQQSDGKEHITEVSWNGSSWINEGYFGGTAAAPGTAVSGYLFNTTPQAFYIGTDGHIYEIFKPSGGNWTLTDVTAASGAPLPSSGSHLLGYKFNSNAPIHYLTNDGHVHQIWWNGSSWKTDDVTNLAHNAPTCLAGTPIAGYMFNGQPTVNCSVGGILQMWWTGSQELSDDWTTLAGGSPEFVGPLAGYAVGNHNTIFYLDNGAPTVLLYEYVWNGSTTQRFQLQHTFYNPVGLATAVF